MSRLSFVRFLVFLLSLSLLMAACAPAATPTPETPPPTEAPAQPTQPPAPTPTPQPTATPPPQVGSPERPIKVLFVPSVDAEKIVASGQLLAETLNKATGLTFEVVVPTSYAATLEEMCASPDDTMGFIPGLGYVLAEQLCGVKVAGKAVRFGYDWYAAMIVVARDSTYQTVADLNGKKWAYPDAASTSGYLYPLYMFKEAGVTPGETVAAGSHDAAIKAVYNGEADFGTAFFSPPRVDGKSIEWQPGQDPDVPADLLDSCAPTQDEKALICGNFEIRDARRNLRKELPDVAQKVRILTTTPKIPNDTVSFGPEFPEDLMQKIMEALFAFAQNDPEGFAKALEAYSWTSINPATDAEYDPIRLAIQASGFKIENLGQ
ncbi:MAG: phosphate/phosphite/phosphonate ABC transporter substrate-binding protein [Anaerolineales bacterium]